MAFPELRWQGFVLVVRVPPRRCAAAGAPSGLLRRGILAGRYEEGCGGGRAPRAVERDDLHPARSRSAISSTGLRNRSRLRGRSLSSAATQSRSSALWIEGRCPSESIGGGLEQGSERATSVSLMTSSSTYSWTSHSGGNSPIPH